MEDFIYRVKVSDALQWTLHGTCLSYVLVDVALSNAPSEIQDNVDGECDVEIVGDEFVVVCSG